MPRDLPPDPPPDLLTDLLSGRQLVCPACRGGEGEHFRQHALALAEVREEREDRVLHGFLACTGCGARYPILDGVAVVVRDLPAWLRQNERAVFWRRDLPPGLEGWLHGAWPDHQDPNWRRQMLATYARALLPPDPPPGADSYTREQYERRQRTLAFLHERQASLVEAAGPRPLVIDAGAAVGANALAMARHGARVIALDHDFGPLRLLSELLHRGRVRVPVWNRGGFDYGHTEVTRPAGEPVPAVLPLAADATDPPLRARTAHLVTGYHLLDNVADPVHLVRQLHALLRPGGVLALSTPYDWVSRCTPPPARLGEAIRRNPQAPPDPCQALRDLLTGRLPALAPELACTLQHEREALPWVLPRHARSLHAFLCHYLEATRTTGPTVTPDPPREPGS